LHAVGDAWVHGGATRQDCIGVQILANINVALHDRAVAGFVNTSGFHAEERWLEQSFWTSESLIANGDYLTIWQLVGLLQLARCRSCGHFLLKIQGDVAQLFLD